MAADVTCGTTLTSSTVLTADLTCAVGDALVIGADSVVLDLGGHTITGPSTGAPGAGIRSAGRSGVTIKNGIITGFNEGVVLDESRSHVVSKLTVRGNIRGINLAGGGGHVVEKITATGNGGDGIRLGLSTGNVIAKNVLTDNVWGVSVADGSSHNLVSKNIATGSHANGVAVFGGASDTTVEKNEVYASWGSGIQVNSDTTGTLLVKNYAASNGDDGLHVDSADATITKNVAVTNVDFGIYAVSGVTDGGGNQAQRNGNPAQCTGVACSPVQ
ncbi:MAG: right-handed parallel beta-helix repeat-containing protein [Nocardioides sp.]